jgi:ubiquinone/menaquinone biosynthesis C-methylase UbiE
MQSEKYSYRYTRFYTNEFPEMLKEFDYRDKVVLDLGAGDGEILYALDGWGWLDDAKKVIAVEISPMRCKLLKREATTFVTKIEVHCADATMLRGLIYDKTVDIIICNQVIEHIVDENLLIMEIYRIMKPGAVCYLSTVFKEPFNFAYHRNEAGMRVLDPTHLREYTDNRLFFKLKYLFDIPKAKKSLQWFAITDFILGRLRIMGHVYEDHKWLAWLRKFKLPIVGCMNWEMILIKPARADEVPQKLQ